MVEQIDDIKRGIDAANQLPAFKAAKKMEIAQKCLGKALGLMAEMAHRIETLEIQAQEMQGVEYE